MPPPYSSASPHPAHSRSSGRLLRPVGSHFSLNGEDAPRPRHQSQSFGTKSVPRKGAPLPTGFVRPRPERQAQIPSAAHSFRSRRLGERRATSISASAREALRIASSSAVIFPFSSSKIESSSASARSAALAILCSSSASSLVVKRIALAIVCRWMNLSASPFAFNAGAWPAVTSTK